ncbi:hypothetical protein JR347_07955 [Fulvivirga lutea]|uniref:Uncharacterized protein n=2 Tax=Fulvivirga lutea TaxID=2810512 RepID=A0A974WK91_9BACT|nr:hypothetical protein JR347_07955 [Fulvivirga lutea]
MTPTEEHIKEIAELLDCGHVCFFHEQTGTIEYYPNPDSEYFDPEPWQETIDRIDADLDNYLPFEKMDSRQGFQMMEDFAHSLTDTDFRERLFKLLSEGKPFSKFKWAIDNSEYRQDWFDFKKQANINWVRSQIE